MTPIGYHAFHTNNIFTAKKIEFMGTGFEITGLLDFDFVTETLGTLRCRWAKKEDAAEIDRLARAGEIDGQGLARKLIEAIAYAPKKPDIPPAKEDDSNVGSAPTAAQLDELSPAELNAFCDQYIRLRLRIGPGERTADTAAGNEARGCDALAGAIVVHADARLAEMRKIIEQFSGSEAVWKKRLNEIVAPITSGKFFADEMAKYSANETATQIALGHLQKSAAVSGIQSAAAAEIAKKYSLNSTAAQIALGRLPTGAAALSGVQAAFERMEASDRLGASIAAAREPKHIVFHPPITILQNPLPALIRESNSLLEQQLAKDNETALIHQNSAALLQGMAAEATGHTNFLKQESDKASVSASRAMIVAIFSIAISVCVGIASILYAREANQIARLSPTAIDLEKQITALATSAKLDRDQSEKQAAIDRAAFTKAISKMYDNRSNSKMKKSTR